MAGRAAMTYVKIDDAFPDHPKFLQAGPVAGYLALAAIAWSGRNARDGIIPRAQVARLANLEGVAIDNEPDAVMGDDVSPYELAEILVKCGLWHKHREGYQIHDYLDHQRSRAEIEAARQKERERWARRNGGGGDE